MFTYISEKERTNAAAFLRKYTLIKKVYYTNNILYYKQINYLWILVK